MSNGTSNKMFLRCFDVLLHFPVRNTSMVRLDYLLIVLSVWAPAGLIGVNLWPQEPSRRYMLCPRSMFCEFLPESSLEEETPPTLLMEEVKEGQNYELVITNASGLFRSDFIYNQQGSNDETLAGFVG